MFKAKTISRRARKYYSPNRRIMRRHLAVEPLEDRRLLSVGFALGFGDVLNADYARSVEADPDGNVYVSGQFQGTVDFNPASVIPGDTVTSDGYDDGFIAKYDPAGNFQWVHTIGGTGYQVADQVELDAAGNVYVLGNLQGTGPHLWKFTQSAGGLTAAWDVDLGSRYYRIDLEVDPSGNAYVGTHDWGSSNQFDISKYDTFGSHVWTTSVHGDTVMNREMSLRANGNLLIAGSFNSTLNIAGETLVSNGQWDVLIAELDVVSTPTSPSWAWATSFGTGGRDESNGIAEAPDGSVVFSSKSYDGTRVTKLDSTGQTVVWETLASGFPELVGNVEVDADGNIYTAGDFNGSMTFGTDTVWSNGGIDIYVVKLDSAGNVLWNETVGESDDQRLAEIDLDPSGNLITTGYYKGTMVLPLEVGATPTTVSITAAGSAGDMFLWKMVESSSPVNDVPVIENSDLVLSSTSIDENGTVTLNGSFVDLDASDVHTVEISWDDGTPVDFITLPVGVRTFSIDHKYVDDGVSPGNGTSSDDYDITVTVSDGTDNDSATATITVNNVAPTADAGIDQTVDEGQEVNFSGFFTDPGTLDTHTYAWDFGDGTTASGTIDPTHVYGDNGVYTVTLTVTDDDTGVGSDTMTVTVNNVAPSLAAAGGFDSPFELSDLLPENGGDGTAGFVINGVNPGDLMGWSVSDAGDINGDGLGDILVSAFAIVADGKPGAGQTYVVFGTTSGFDAELTPTILNGTNGFVINGANADDGSGWSVAGLGDMNGDGFDDMAIGAVGVNDGAGAVHVVFGHGGPFASSLDLSTLNGTNGFTVNGATDDGAGYSVNGAGDVNGDGFNDLLIGAVGANDNRGAVYVVFGHAAPYVPSLDVTSLDGTSGFVISLDSLAPSDALGWSISGVGDVNDDGVDDLLIGCCSSANSSAGESFVVFGHHGPFADSLDLSTLDGTNGFVVNGRPGDSAGYSVSGAGDVNGDGVDDLLIGALAANDGAGAGYVIFGHGAPFAASMDVSSLNGTNGFMISGGPDDYVGVFVSRAGDVNQDGLDDLVIGGFGLNDFAGGCYVVFGSDEPFAAILDVGSLNGNNGVAIYGITPGDMTGWSVSGAGDVNGDGSDDLLIGAFNANGGTGAGYVVFGKSSVDEPIEIDEGGSVTLSDTATDPGSDDLTFTWNWGDGTVDTVTTYYNDGIGPDPYPSPEINPMAVTDTVSHTYGDNGVYTVTLTVEDDDGGVSVATTTVTVNNVAPVAGDDVAATDEDNPVTFNVLTNDTDVGTLDVLTAVPASFTTSQGGLVTILSDGTAAYDPNGQFEQLAVSDTAVDSFTYTVQDDDSGTDVGTVTITIHGVNDAPVAVDDSAVTDEDTPVAIDVLANDSDIDGDPLTAVLVGDVSDGTLVLNADGSFTYTPDADFNGTDSFTYKANDGTADSNVATVTITVDPVNDAPVAVDDSAVTDEDIPVAIDVLANDSDIDGDPLMVASVTQPSDGTVVDNGDGTLSYTPAANFNGTDNFTYTVSDGNGGSDTATVTVTVLESESPVEIIMSGIQQLISDGTLNEGQGNALIKKVEGAIEKLEQGNINAAVGKLGAFINQVEAMVNSGRLTPQQGQLLIDAAEEIINSALSETTSGLDSVFTELGEDNLAGDSLLGLLDAELLDDLVSNDLSKRGRGRR